MPKTGWQRLDRASLAWFACAVIVTAPLATAQDFGTLQGQFTPPFFVTEFEFQDVSIFNPFTRELITSVSPDATGFYTIDLPADLYWVEGLGVDDVEGCGTAEYLEATIALVNGGEVTVLDFNFDVFKGCGGGQIIPDYIAGKVLNARNNQPVPNATVALANFPDVFSSTPATGVFSFINPFDTTVVASADGFEPGSPLLASLNGTGDNTIFLRPFVVVPDVTGLSQANASTALIDAGLLVGNVSEQSSVIVPAGNVISQSIVAGTEVVFETTVDLVISTGAPLEAVPDVVGLPQATAEAAITNAGFAVGTVAQVSSDTVPAGSIISQSPLGGTLAALGSQVDLIVSTGPSAPGTIDENGGSVSLPGVDVTIAPGELGPGESVTVTIAIAPLPGTPAPEGILQIFEATSFQIDGLTELGDGTFTLTLDYPDADQDGIVDGTGLSETGILIMRFDAASQTWIPLASTVDAVANTVTVTLSGQEFGKALDAGDPIVAAAYSAAKGADVDQQSGVNAVDVQLVINGALGLSTNGFYVNVDGQGGVDAVDVQLTINAALASRKDGFQPLEVPTWLRRAAKDFSPSLFLRMLLEHAIRK